MAASGRRLQLPSLLQSVHQFFVGDTEPPPPRQQQETTSVEMPTTETNDITTDTSKQPTKASPPVDGERTKTEDVKPEVTPTPPQHTLLSVYCSAEMAILDRKMARFTSLSSEEQEILKEYSERLQALAVRVNGNGKFLQSLMKHGTMFLSNAFEMEEGEEEGDDENEKAAEIRGLFMDIARDWSEQGSPLRNTIYKPLINAIIRAYDEYSSIEESTTRSKFRVLVPGAGTGRLCWELASVGFAVEGCEMSSVQLATSNYMLNHASKDTQHSIYPYAHTHSNIRDANSMLEACQVPDVTARALESNVEFGMRVGRCVDVYADGSSDASFDAVVSCLVDEFDEHTALNIRTVSEVLRPGGVWVFLGPKPAPRDDASLALTLSVPEFVAVVKRSGFKILSESNIDIPLTIGNSSLRKRNMNAKFFTAMKVRPMK